MPANVSQIDRALAILRVDSESPAELLADALWLASVLPTEIADNQSGAKPCTSPPTVPSIGQESPPNLAEHQTGGIKRSPSSGPVPVYPSQTPVEGEEFSPATFVAIPAADALPKRLEIERALKPFLKRFPSRKQEQLDADKTAQASADRRMVTPIFEPSPERWFDVVLLVEKDDAMEVWTDTVKDFQILLGRHGAFRNVRLIQFSTGRSISFYTASGQPLSPRSIVDPEGRRLCLFLTHGASSGWRQESLVNFLRMLGRRNVVAILQMLPQRAWSHTALGDPSEYVYSLIPGGPNTALEVEDPVSGSMRRASNARYVPVLTLEPRTVSNWSRFVMSPKRTVNRAVLLRARELESEARRIRTPSENLLAFRKTGSREALQLIRVLAGVPLTLPIMRLVQQSVSMSRELHQLAEVMLSGLIVRVTSADAKVPADQVFYDFLPGVRELLLGTHSSQESERLDEVLKPAQERLRAFVESHARTAIKDFRALLSDSQGVERLPASARSFVEVSRKIYEDRGLLAGLSSANPESPAIHEALESPNNRIATPNADGSVTNEHVWPIQRPLAGLSFLWVDDHPENNKSEIATFRRMGAAVVERLTTTEGLSVAQESHCDLILTDMARGKEREAGLDLLVRLRGNGITVPVIIYASRFAESPESREKARSLGAFACTNRQDVLFTEVFRAAGKYKDIQRFSGIMREIGFGEDDSLAMIQEQASAIADSVAQHASSVESLNQAFVALLDAVTGCDYVQMFFGQKTLTLAADHVGKGKARYREASSLGVIGRAHRQAKTTWLSNVLDSRDYISAEKSTRSELALPIFNQERQAVGVVNLESADEDAFSPEQIRWLEDLVSFYPLPRRVARPLLISSEADINIAKYIERELKSAGVQITRDEKERGGAVWTLLRGSKKSQQIEDFDCYIAILSPSALSSDTFSQTMDAVFRRYQSSREATTVIPVLVQPCELPDRLALFQSIDFIAGSEAGIKDLLWTLQTLRLDPPWRFGQARERRSHLEDSRAQSPLKRMNVLVVGTGAHDLPEAVQIAAEQTGNAVARAGANLIVGGWPGVDHLTARAFTENLSKSNDSSTDRLLLFLEGDETPDFKGGKIRRVPPERSMTEPIQLADVIIFIGGAGSTWQMFRNALSMKKRVIPLLNTGTDAHHAAVLLEIFGQNVPRHIVSSEFGSSSEAKSIVEPLQVLLTALNKMPTEPSVDNRELLWMTDEILPVAQRYLKREHGFDEEAEKLFKELRSRKLSPVKREQLVFALTRDADPSWRCVGYLAIESGPNAKFNTRLVEGLETEMDFGILRVETRPLWRLLAATNRMVEAHPQVFPYRFVYDLELAEQRLQKLPNLDPGGQCKASLHAIAQKLRSTDASPDSVA